MSRSHKGESSRSLKNTYVFSSLQPASISPFRDFSRRQFPRVNFKQLQLLISIFNPAQFLFRHAFIDQNQHLSSYSGGAKHIQEYKETGQEPVLGEKVGRPRKPFTEKETKVIRAAHARYRFGARMLETVIRKQFKICIGVNPSEWTKS